MLENTNELLVNTSFLVVNSVVYVGYVHSNPTPIVATGTQHLKSSVTVNVVGKSSVLYCQGDFRINGTSNTLQITKGAFVHVVDNCYAEGHVTLRDFAHLKVVNILNNSFFNGRTFDLENSCECTCGTFSPSVAGADFRIVFKSRFYVADVTASSFISMQIGNGSFCDAGGVWTQTGPINVFGGSYFGGADEVVTGAVTRGVGGTTLLSGALTTTFALLEHTGISNVSTRDTKQDIEVFTDSGLDIIDSIDVVSYNYKEEMQSNTDVKRIGFIADDTDSRVSNNQTNMDMCNMIGVLTKSVQELKAEIDILKGL